MFKMIRSRKGFGLILMVMLTAVSGVLVLSSTRVFQNRVRQTQLRIDQAKARHLAQAGVMQAAWNWYTNVTTNEVVRKWDQINTTVTGNNLFKVGMDSAAADLQSNFAYYVPSFAFVKNVMTLGSNGSATTAQVLTIPASTTVPVGNFVVLAVAMDAVGTAPNIGTVANNWLDSKGNTWALRKDCANANAATVVRTVVFSAPITTALTTGDTVTVRWTTNVTAKAFTMFEFSGIDTYDTAFDGANACTNVANGVGGTGPATLSITSTVANEILVGAIGVEGSAGDAFTVGTNYLGTPPTAIGIGATTSGAKINPEYRFVSSTGGYIADGVITSRDWAATCTGFYAANRWFNSGGNWRLRQWQVYNINNGGALTLAQMKVSWSPAGSSLLSDISLNNVSVIPGGGPFASGTTVNITDTALAANTAWQGVNTYLQWNGVMPDPVAVTVQFIWSGDTATTDARSHEVVLWNGLQSGAGMPLQRTFTVTATGQVNQTTAGSFKVLKTVKATVSGAPGRSALEITDWDEGEKNIP